ncbi:hypothetical protein MTO96_017905 [Rhipicephalus appendiculatus]
MCRWTIALKGRRERSRRNKRLCSHVTPTSGFLMRVISHAARPHGNRGSTGPPEQRTEAAEAQAVVEEAGSQVCVGGLARSSSVW